MQASTRARQPRRINWQRRRVLTFVALVAPVFLFRLVTSAYPILNTIRLSFTNTDLIANTNAYIGLANFAKLPQDPAMKSALGFTIAYVLISSAMQLFLGLMVALLLNASYRGRGFGRAINLIPWAIPGIVAAYAFRWLLDDQFGLIPQWIYLLTHIRPVIFITPLGAQTAVILVTLWKNVPFVAVLFLAGLQGVPMDLYEAAKVDGANTLQRFWSITLPLVMPLLTTMSIFFIIGQLGNLDLAFGLTNGGPGTATATFALRILQEGLNFYKFGYASAISVVLLLLVALVGAIGLVVNRKVEVNI
jgi:multiple sugar transport system permease protein